MKSNKFMITLMIILGVLSLIALYFMRLALTDIYNNEPDLTLEWNIIKIGFVVVVAFIVVAVVTFVRLFTRRIP